MAHAPQPPPPPCRCKHHLLPAGKTLLLPVGRWATWSIHSIHTKPLPLCGNLSPFTPPIPSFGFSAAGRWKKNPHGIPTPAYTTPWPGVFIPFTRPPHPAASLLPPTLPPPTCGKVGRMEHSPHPHQPHPHQPVASRPWAISPFTPQPHPAASHLWKGGPHGVLLHPRADGIHLQHVDCLKRRIHLPQDLCGCHYVVDNMAVMITVPMGRSQ